MPQLDFNAFAGIAWWITIVFYFSYVWLLVLPFARIVSASKALQKYRLYKMIQLGKFSDDLKKKS